MVYPALLEEVVMGALQRDHDKRTPTAKVFADSLEKYLHAGDEPTSSVQVSDWVRSFPSADSTLPSADIGDPEDHVPTDSGSGIRISQTPRTMSSRREPTHATSHQEGSRLAPKDG